MLRGLLWLLLAGCDGCSQDPEVQSRREAAVAWDEGIAALEAGQPAAAVDAFARAEALDPASPVLAAWRARALELGGDDDAALAVLDQALGRFPGDTSLRFNRAGLRARRGDLDGAAADLHLLLRAGAVQPEEASADPDLVALRRRPELAALVPAPTIGLEVAGEAGSVLLGDSYDAVVLLDAPTGEPLEVREMGTAPGLLRRQRVVEDVVASRPGRTRHRLELTWQAVLPGVGQLGPWLVTGGGTSGLSEALAVEIVEVGNRSGRRGSPAGEGLVVPSSVVGDRSAPWAGAIDDRLVVLAPAGATIEVRGPAGPVAPDETWELRDDGQPRWTAACFADPGPVEVEVLVGRQAVLSQAWPPSG